MNNVWVLLVVYQFKHWICDYPLQNNYMLGKFKHWPSYILPLTAHCAIHGFATFLIALVVRPDLAFYLGLLDFSSHFIIDRVKASPNLGGRFKALSASEFPTVVNMSNGIMPIPCPKSQMDTRQEWAKDRLTSNKLFWWTLGLDQMAHHVTHYLIIYTLLS